MSDDYEIDYEETCPKCGNEFTHIRQCMEITCNEGWIDESEENFSVEGTDMVMCEDCKGTGWERWCPNCGANLSGIDLGDNQEYYDSPKLPDDFMGDEPKKL